MAASVKPYEKITDPPTNVKEAIDWLIRIGEWDNSTSGGSVNRTNCNALQGAIQKLTGSTSRTFTTAIKDLISDLSKFLGYQNGQINGGGIIKKDGNYTSAYNQSSATWPTCKSAGTCSCCQGSQGSSCNCTVSAAKSCDGSCCNTCDIRICAGIFVALVPALDKALRELKDKLKEKGQKNITDSSLKEHFIALGYEEEQLNGRLQASHVNSKLSSAVSKLGQLKNKILGRDGYFKGIDNSASSTSPSSSTSTSSPGTVREMLLWLMGLPYCQNYKAFVEKLEEKKEIVSSSTRSSNPNENPFAKQLSAVIFHLPTLFYSVEGRISYLKEVFEQFKNGGQVKFHYPNGQDGTDLLKTLSAYVAVCYPILKYLMQRCDKENTKGRGRRGATGPGTTPIAEEKDGSWGDCLVSGEENSSTEGPQTKSSTATPSSAPKTALRDFLVFMGFKTGNDTVTGDDLYENALKDCFSESMKTDDEDEEKDAGATAGARYPRSTASSKKYDKLPALRKLAKHVLQQAYKSGSGSHAPTTIRQMMLWLIGLPLTTAYKSNGNSLVGKDGPVLQEINKNAALMALEQQSAGRGHSTPATGKYFKQQLKDSIVGMIMLFQRIEGGLGSVLEFLKGGFKDGGGGSSAQPFQYNFENDNGGGTNGKTIFNEFNTYVYKVHVQLRFLKVMCKAQKSQGGWSECTYANGSCTCNGSVASCLKLFLQNGNSGSGANGNKFKLYQSGESKQTECLQMGFKAYDPQNNNQITGASITPYLEQLLDDIPTPPTQTTATVEFKKPLSLLTQYCVAIGPVEPSSLGDHFEVFRELANGMWSKIEGEVQNSLANITKRDNNGDTASNALKGALQAVWPGAHTKHNDESADLRSLTGCHEGACTPFVASLSYGLYKYCDPTKLQVNLAHRINWLYMKMSGLYGKLVTLKEEMEKECQCCPEGRPQSTGCNGITQCPVCLPLMYKMGLVFGSAEKLSVKSGAKKCRDLMGVMEKVLDATSKLCVVFKSIDDKRFWPYLLFSAMVVKDKQLTVKKDGDENYNCYTVALGSEYEETYLKEKKSEAENKAQQYKTARDNALKCTCPPHTYQELKPVSGTATTVTLTLYFQGAYITQAVTITVPHHYPFYNPLVRFYPRNLKCIVDWLLRIGQTRLGQDGSAASMDELCKTFWPNIRNQLNAQDQKMFKDLVEKVTTMMGLESKGKEGVETELDGKLEDVKDKIQKKLKNGTDKFDDTFQSILTFNPKDYIDKVIDDFGKRVCTVKEASGSSKPRSFNCIAKSVSECMQTALQTIKELVKKNKSEMEKYGVTGIEELSGTITEVQQLNNISNLKQLCDGFKTFHEAYDKVTKAFNSHLSTAQKNGGSAPWTNINKCVEAFKELGECVQELGELGGFNNAEKMTQASGKLNELSGKLNEVHEKLNGDGLSTFSEKVTEFIKQLDEALKKEGEKGLAQALQIHNGGSAIDFNTFLKYYVSELITKMKSNSIGSDKNNTSVDIHLRVRNDLQQLSECLKVMCEVCSTGMKDFAEELRKCVDQGKGHLEKINTTKSKLDSLNKKLEEIKEASSQDSVKDKVTSAISSIKELLDDPYIYQTQPIVDKLIDNNAMNNMTNYLKSLPDLIRDRYVLQKWKDDSAYFCGVQEFKEGIVKESDIKGITDKLKELLKDTFHTTPANDITIHEFQVRALMYNFCYKEGIKRIDCGIKVMRYLGFSVIKNDVEWNKVNKTDLKRVVDDISGNSYLRYFATHLRDSVGYHTLSNTLGALEQVKEKLKESNGTQPNDWDKIQELLKKDAMKQLYDRLQALVDKLNREYIFEYPPFDWTKSCQRLVREQEEAKKAARQRRSLPDTPSVSPSPTASNTCSMCVPSMAHIFIGFVPQMYRLFKMLREMANKKKDVNDGLMVYKNNGRDESKTTMSSLAGILSREGWRVKVEGQARGVPGEAYDLDNEKTGKDICPLLEDIIGDKEPGVLLAQRENNVSTTDSLKPLEQLFKAVMQHFRDKREKLRQKREQALRTAFDEKYKDSGLQFVAPPAPLPSTVRQVLFWLHEMDTNKAFYDQMSQHIEALCHQSRIGISQETILHVLKLSITQCLEVLATIEDPGRQNADYYYELYTEEHYYDYPTVNVPLFFYTFVEKLMAAFLELNFVCVQCEFRALEGGWKDCHIGKSEHSMKGQNCRCTKSHTKASAFIPVTVSGSVVCPRPLSAFLFSDQKNQLKVPMDPTLRLPYMSKGTIPCGFQLKNKAITDAATPGDASTPTTPLSTSVTGSVLVEPLRKLVGGHVKGRHTYTSTRSDENYTLNTVIYLRDLLRYTLCLAVRPPWSMSENMAFFYRVTESWKKNNNVVGGVRVAQRNAKLLGAIHNEIDLFPGSFDGKLLTSAVERFAGVDENEKHGTSVPASPQSSHQFDLRTLMGCQEITTTGTIGTTAQCSYFMFPLSLDVYTHYDHKNSRAYLSWILNFAFGIYGQLRGLEEMIKEKECVKSTASNKPSKCPSLPMCPGVLSALYQSGSSFMDQKVLADVSTNNGRTTTTKKTCAQFRDVLHGLFNCDSTHCSPLHNLIVQCEAFLWSIRLPFSLVQLSLWSVAILFISYVFVVPLDHFKIKSHLFNRLKYTMHPSLLIADQQRRVSEVAYFSL